MHSRVQKPHRTLQLNLAVGQAQDKVECLLPIPADLIAIQVKEDQHGQDRCPFVSVEKRVIQTSECSRAAALLTISG